MKRIKIMGLCLVAVFALAAAAAASASATPTYYECKKGATNSGEYSDKKCSVNVGAGKGKYSLVPGRGKNKVFKGKGGAATLYTPAVGGEVKCSTSKDEGFVNASFTGQEKVKVIFGKCVSLGKNCSSPGAKKGEIKTNPLEGTLGYISASGPSVGVSLTGEAGKPSAEFNCEGLEIVTTGSVIGPVTGDINTFSKESTDTFKTASGVQVPTKFEGGPKEVLESLINGSGPFESGEETTAKNKGEELEIKA